MAYDRSVVLVLHIDFAPRSPFYASFRSVEAVAAESTTHPLYRSYDDCAANRIYLILVSKRFRTLEGDGVPTRSTRLRSVTGSQGSDIVFRLRHI